MSEAENFLPIQSIDIEAETTINFNLYVNLPLNKKYILYRRAGAQVESQTLERLTDGNVANFFIEKKDYSEFIRYVSNRLCTLIGQSDATANRKAMETAAKSILTSTLDQSDASIASILMANLNDITGMIIENALENTDGTVKKLFRRLAQLAEKGTDFQKHPVNVASLAVLITFGIGYSREESLADVAMAALLHDLGLSKVPPKIAAQSHNVLRLPMEERQWIYKHPEIAVDILEEKKIPVSQITKTIILQHHEEFNGNGYPFGMRGFLINELSQILHVADEIDQLFVDMADHPTPLKIRVAELLRRFSDQKVTEPLLLSRIRKVLI